MATKLLQKFLDVGLFNFGEDDQRLKDFEAASEDLAKEFAKSPRKVIPAVLVAIDAAVPDEDPILNEVEAAIKSHWNSFRNKFPDRPKAFLRPVLWEALCQAAAKSPEIAAAVWLTGASVLRHLAIPKERGIVEEFLLSQGQAMETAAGQAWALSQSQTEYTAPPLEFEFPKIQGGSMDQAALEEGLQAASGPSNQNNSRINNANQHWPNQGQQWSWQFAPRAAAVITEQVNKALAPLVNQASVLGEQTEPQLKEFGKKISAAMTQWVNASARGLAQRSTLLWWRESLYSPSLCKGYRDLSPIEVAVGMALDLSQLASAPSPQSVEFFLREAVYAALPKRPKISLSEVFLDVNRSKVLGDLLAPPAPPLSLRRVSLLTAIHFARQTKFEDSSLPAWIGVKGDLKQPIAEFAVWLFRDAQAISLTSKPASK